MACYVASGLLSGGFRFLHLITVFRVRVISWGCRGKNGGSGRRLRLLQEHSGARHRLKKLMMMTAPSAHLRRAPEAENVENETPAIVQTTLEEESTN